jgi:hypothetical protein
MARENKKSKTIGRRERTSRGRVVKERGNNPLLLN